MSVARAAYKFSIPTTYNGIRYRSKLEAAWAQFFDRHRMKFAYEPEGFDFGGVRYLPDFYLPDIKTFVEVKGVLDGKDCEKVFALASAAAPRGIMVILAETPVGEGYRLVEPTPQQVEASSCCDSDWGPPLESLSPGFSNEVCLALCARCNTWYFMEAMMGWGCTACGFYDGDNSFKEIHEPNPADWGQRGRCPDCGK